MAYGKERFVIPVHLKLKMIQIARDFRKQPTPSEDTLWQALRRKQLKGVRFRRQQPLGCFVVDFFSAEHRLIVEVDGSIHATQQQADIERQAMLESLEFRFVRVTADEVESNLPAVLEKIGRALPPSPIPRPLPPQGGKGRRLR